MEERLKRDMLPEVGRERGQGVGVVTKVRKEVWGKRA